MVPPHVSCALARTGSAAVSIIVRSIDAPARVRRFRRVVVISDLQARTVGRGLDYGISTTH